MRTLLALLALGSCAAFADDATDKRLLQCVMPEAQYGRYSSYDGGKSAVTILMEKCPHEWAAWYKACRKTGDTEDSCIAKGGVIAQMAIKSFGK